MCAHGFTPAYSILAICPSDKPGSYAHAHTASSLHVCAHVYKVPCNDGCSLWNSAHACLHAQLCPSTHGTPCMSTCGLTILPGMISTAGGLDRGKCSCIIAHCSQSRRWHHSSPLRTAAPRPQSAHAGGEINAIYARAFAKAASTPPPKIPASLQRQLHLHPKLAGYQISTLVVMPSFCRTYTQHA